MARYIDADYVIDGIKRKASQVELNKTAKTVIDLTINLLEEVAAADSVEVVHCGECERRSKGADLTNTIYCPWIKQQMNKTDFCSYGQRK